MITLVDGIADRILNDHSEYKGIPMDLLTVASLSSMLFTNMNRETGIKFCNEDARNLMMTYITIVSAYQIGLIHRFTGKSNEEINNIFQDFGREMLARGEEAIKNGQVKIIKDK